MVQRQDNKQRTPSPNQAHLHWLALAKPALPLEDLPVVGEAIQQRALDLSHVPLLTIGWKQWRFWS